MPIQRTTPVRDGSTPGPASTADSVGPVLTSEPPHGQRIDAPIVFTFSEAVKLGPGTISLFAMRVGLVYSAPLAGNPYVAMSGNTITFTPPLQLTPVEWYSVTISAGAITDLAGNAFYGGSALDVEFTSGLSLVALNLSGTADVDTLHGSDLADTIDGLAEGDTIFGYGGDDILRGGDETRATTLWTFGDTIKGGAGNDTVYGGTGEDQLHGDEGNDRLFGDDDDDRLYGGAGDDHLDGGAGNDVLDGGAGRNEVFGGDGDDTLDAESGSGGTLDGGTGNDLLRGFEGTNYAGGDGGDEIVIDFMNAHPGPAMVSGGSGNDSITLRVHYVSQAVAAVSGGDGIDTYHLYGMSSVMEGANDFTVTDFKAGAGGDMIDLLDLTYVLGGGNAFVNGLVRLVASGDDTVLELRDPGDRTNSIYITGLTLKGVRPEQLTAANFTGGMDPKSGELGLNFSGDAGNDIMDGGPGADVLSGLAGNDILNGRAGDDLLDGGDGNDLISGGAGNNTLRGGDGDDSMGGGHDGSNVLEGGAGKDHLTSSYGNDRLSGGDGNDELLLADAGLTGRPGNTVVLSGDAGDDIIRIRSASVPATVLASGGAGADTFIVRAITGLTILDFSREDLLDLRELLALRVRGTIPGNPFGALGYLKAVQEGSQVWIHLDSDGAAGANGAELVLKLDNTLLSALSSAVFAGGYDPSGSTRGLDLHGTPGADTLFGAALDDTIDGGDGADIIDGGAGNDRLVGGDESMAGIGDDIRGGAGSDQLHGGAGDDRLDGGEGDDMLYGGDGNDRLNGGLGNDRLEGGDGNDTLDASQGDDYLSGGAGDDVLAGYRVRQDRPGGTTLDGGDGNDRLYPTSVVKLVLGGAGDDEVMVDADGKAASLAPLLVDMGDGNDRLLFGYAADEARPLRVSGGAGVDSYGLLNSSASKFPLLTVTDFRTGAGGDVLDVRSFILGDAGPNPFGPAAFARLVQEGSHVLFQVDPDGSSGAQGWTTRAVLENTRVADFTGANFPGGIRPDGGLGGLVLVGGAGADTIDGGDLDDTLRGGEGADTLRGSAGADRLHGDGGDDVLLGGDGDDLLDGGDGKDVLAGHGGDDRLDGRGGIDTAVFLGARADYLLQAEGEELLVSGLGGSAGDGNDRLSGIERLVFGNGALALDSGPDGNAGQAYRIYRAAFDREPDQVGLGFWIEMLDRGVTLQAVAAGFTRGDEFARLYGANPGNADIVTRLYRNILDREPEKGGYDFWLSVLDNKLADLGTVLAAFSESPENRAAVAELIGNGVNYHPYVG
ncbi:MAG: DUF4214 domain-containing protein [Pseudomonadota bacterium]